MDTEGLTDAERAELERLRAEVGTLRSRLEGREAAGDGAVVPAPQAGSARWRTLVATALIVVACALATLAPLAMWASNQITDTDRYLRTVSPLIDDPAIQNALANQITAQIFTYVDVRGLTTEAADALAERGASPAVANTLRALSGPIANGVQSFTRTQVGRVVSSDAFATAWVEANRVAHEELVKALTGQGGAVTVSGDTVSVHLAALIAVVKDQLTAAGFDLAARIPEVDASFVLFQNADISRVQTAFNLLDTLGTWLPIIVLLLLALGVYVAKSHRRALIGAGIGVALAMLVLAIGLLVARALYLNAMPASVLPADAAAVLYDTIVRYLRIGLRIVLVAGLVVAAGGFLAGPSVTAVRIRGGLARAIAWLRGAAGTAGPRTGPVGAWTADHKRPLEVVTVVVAGLALVFWDDPTGKVVVVILVLLLAALAVIEFLARPAGPAGTVPTPQT
jgi:hypothetical protein